MKHKTGRGTLIHSSIRNTAHNWSISIMPKWSSKRIMWRTWTGRNTGPIFVCGRPTRKTSIGPIPFGRRHNTPPTRRIVIGMTNPWRYWPTTPPPTPLSKCPWSSCNVSSPIRHVHYQRSDWDVRDGIWNAPPWPKPTLVLRIRSLTFTGVGLIWNSHITKMKLPNRRNWNTGTNNNNDNNNNNNNNKMAKCLPYQVWVKLTIMMMMTTTRLCFVIVGSITVLWTWGMKRCPSHWGILLRCKPHVPQNWIKGRIDIWLYQASTVIHCRLPNRSCKHPKSRCNGLIKSRHNWIKYYDWPPNHMIGWTNPIVLVVTWCARSFPKRCTILKRRYWMIWVCHVRPPHCSIWSRPRNRKWNKIQPRETYPGCWGYARQCYKWIKYLGYYWTKRM